MKKILVPTDFSVNSKSGVRFAINWAVQQKLELTFIHVLYLMRPARWTDSNFEKYAEKEKTLCNMKFKKFIAGVYRNLNVKPGNHSLEIVQGISADISILDYCRKNKDFDYICISTRGAGKFNKIFGTNTGNLITKSKIPVLAVPKNYKVADIKNVMYASDFRNYTEELNRVIEFTLPLKAQIEVLHFAWPNEINLDEKTIQAAYKDKYRYSLKIHFEKYNAAFTMIQNIQKQIDSSKPSVVIMFTNQDRTFFQKLFLSSKAEELSFQMKVPLLVFNKKRKN